MGNSLNIQKPFKHFVITQEWGRFDPIYEQFGFSRHNGIDTVSSYNDQYTSYNPTSWPLYCPVRDFRVHMMRFSPKGGGHEVWLLSNNRLHIGDKLCYAYMGFAHNKKVFVNVGETPALGEMIAIANNTGAASTGPHSHIGLYRVEWDGKNMTFLDTNDANGSYNPAEFLTDEYAVDNASLQTLIKSNWRYYQYKLSTV